MNVEELINVTKQETVADIVAEMRNDAAEDIAQSPNDTYRLADRIEAAAKREAVAGNAAKLREALRIILASIIPGRDTDDTDTLVTFMGAGLHTGLTKANAALSAPARNCDRYSTLGEAVLASGECTAEAPALLGMGNAQLVRFVKWLFAPAEGGAE